MDVSNPPGWALSLAPINALLNFAATVLLLLGYAAIRRGDKETHRKMMGGAFAVSVVFLVCYLLYHAYVGSIKFTEPGWPRMVYFPILFSHIVLAALVPFMAVRLLYLAANQRFQTHKALARWAWPIWLYVSVTGVLVYLMLYVIWPSTELTPLMG